MSEHFTWVTLNRRLKKLNSEKVVLQLFEQQKKNGANPKFLERIWSRYARLRSKRERKELRKVGA